MSEQSNVPERPNIPVTRIRLQIPQGMSASEVISALEITFEEAGAGAGSSTQENLGATPEIRPEFCCVDASVVSPFSTVNVV